MEELTHALRLLDTGHLHHNAAFLTLEGLDVGLHHAEAVDTGAEHVVRVVDGTLHFAAQHLLHFLVGALRGDLVAQLLGGKQLSQRAFGGQFTIVLDEKRDKIFLALSGLLGGLLHSLAECFVGFFLVVGERLHHVGHAHFQHDIHTALQVQTESDTHLAAVLQRPDAQIHFVVLERIHVAIRSLLAFGGHHVFILALEVAGDHGEAEVEQAYQRQQQREELDKSFVLHCC